MLAAHKNACVNDGTAGSGHEVRSVDTLTAVLEGPGLDLETYEPTPGRSSLVARIEGSDPAAPTLVLMGHTDVVPANPHGWRRDAVASDYLVTESGGAPVASPSGLKLAANVGEKGAYWCKLRVAGTPGHASRPLRTDNALVTAAEVVRRLAEYRPEARISQTWRRYVEGMDFDPELAAAFLDPARTAHACTHTTFAPTVIHGGTKTNVIPDLVELEVDIRSLPGQTGADVRAMLDEALGTLSGRVEVLAQADDPATESLRLSTELWQQLAHDFLG